MRFELQNFITEVHRRARRRRLLDCAAIGLLAGCAAALLAIVLLQFSARTSVYPVMFILVVAPWAAVLFVVRQEASLMKSAAQLDEVCATHDLFSSALAVIQSDRADEFSSALGAMALARSRSISLNVLAVPRFAMRGWCAVGLSAAGVLTSAALLSQPDLSRAGVDRDQNDASTSSELVERTASRDTSAASNQRDRNVPNDISPDNDHRNSDRAIRSDAGNESAPTPGDSTGSSVARTAEPNNVFPGWETRPFDSARYDNRVRNDAAGGIGRAGSSHASNGASGIVTDRNQFTAPPWNAGSWKTVREEALRQVESTRFPDEYRDLVRDYFTRN